MSGQVLYMQHLVFIVHLRQLAANTMDWTILGATFIVLRHCWLLAFILIDI
jgi:hypothetical protein